MIQLLWLLHDIVLLGLLLLSQIGTFEEAIRRLNDLLILHRGGMLRQIAGFISLE